MRPRAKGTRDNRKGPPISRSIACRFDDNLFEDIAALAEARGVRFAEMIRRLCKSGLEIEAAKVAQIAA